MDFSLKNSSWQAQNLPQGFSLLNGILYGSHNLKGSYSVPITVTTPFGSDTKNITINVRSKPGTEKFSILQNGVEIEQVTIPQLAASIRDGSAQNKYNCTNTQLLIPVKNPGIFWANRGTILYQFEGASMDIPLNFCDFQNVTLPDSSVKPGLVLQFDQSIWFMYSRFDTRDIQDSGYCHNRWKFSNLRLWLNSSGANWFSPAYNNDALTEGNNREYAQFSDNNAVGFLSLLPDDLQDILQPVRIVTAVYWDDENENIPEPELIDNIDCDVTFDKVFIPSTSQMGFPVSKTYDSYDVVFPVEGATWAFYSHLQEIGTFYPHFNAMLRDDLRENNIISHDPGILSRTPYISDKNRVFSISYDSTENWINTESVYSPASDTPAPAFVIC